MQFCQPSHQSQTDAQATVAQCRPAIDLDEQGLLSIVDLDLAPRNAQGLVEFAATLTRRKARV